MCHKTNHRIKMIVFSFLLLAAGTILILGNMGIIDKSLFQYIFSWQSLLIAVGVFTLSGGIRDHWFGSTILISIGTLFLIDEIYALQTGVANMIWPILLIIIAIAILVRVFFPRRKPCSSTDEKAFTGMKNEYSSEDYINVSRVFSGANLFVKTQNFKGGQASFVFGGGEFDFRDAKLAEGTNILKIECVFGGVKILVPEDWDISLETSGVFGGFSDDRRRVSIEKIDQTRKLIIKAEAVFGGGEITN